MDYIPIHGTHWGPSYYGIVHNPSTEIWDAFGNFGDHTTGSGLMFASDGPTNPNTVVWQETVNVSSGTDYVFSGWGASMGQVPIGTPFDPNPATLAFFVNDVQIGSPFTVPSPNGQWSQFSAPWNSGTSDVATIKIIDLNTAGGGNDFTMDDLSFTGIAAPPRPRPAGLVIDGDQSGPTNDQIDVRLDPDGKLFQVDVNGTRWSAPLNEVSSIAIHGLQGDDVIRVAATAAGIPVTIDAGDGNDVIDIGLGSLNGLQAPLTVGGGGSNVLNIDDSASPAPPAGRSTYVVSAMSVQRLWAAGITYSDMGQVRAQGQRHGLQLCHHGRHGRRPGVDHGRGRGRRVRLPGGSEAHRHDRRRRRQQHPRLLELRPRREGQPVGRDRDRGGRRDRQHPERHGEPL